MPTHRPIQFKTSPYFFWWTTKKVFFSRCVFFWMRRALIAVATLCEALAQTTRFTFDVLIAGPEFFVAGLRRAKVPFIAVTQITGRNPSNPFDPKTLPERQAARVTGLSRTATQKHRIGKHKSLLSGVEGER